MAIPDEEALLAAVKTIRAKEPTLARAKVLKQLKEENDWELSEKRLKACMAANDLNSTAIAPVPVLAPPKLERFKPRDSIYNEVAKKAFQDYTRLEREFLLKLSEDDAKALIPRPSLWNEGLHLRIATQQRHHVEILLTLKGIKPCTSIHHHLNTAIYTRLVNEILKPLITKYDLESYGFVLRQILHPTMLDQGRPQPSKFWQGGWIFADTRSPLWPEVQSVLLPTAQIDIAFNNLMSYEDKVGKCLGYPVPRHPRETDHNIIRYMDETERQVLAKLYRKSPEDVEVIGFEYFDDDGDQQTWMTCIMHFAQCGQAMESVGSELRPDLCGHPPIEEFWYTIRNNGGF